MNTSTLNNVFKVNNFFVFKILMKKNLSEITDNLSA